jgi:hypothetical protein
MKTAFWARRAHKWIALVIGVQALLWMLSGLYMTSISIDVIHGDHLAHASSTTLDPATRLIDGAWLVKRYPDTQFIRLKHLITRPVYELHREGAVELIDARSGARVGPLDKTTAIRVARSIYRGTAPVESAALLTEAPQEVAARPVPMWQIRFADRAGTTLYIAPDTGELIAKRHDLWRLFDFLWMLHIMDYEERSDVNNTLLRVASAIGLLFSLSGAWLLFYSFRRRNGA